VAFSRLKEGFDSPMRYQLILLGFFGLSAFLRRFSSGFSIFELRFEDL
jgi:hypothetical protein